MKIQIPSPVRNLLKISIPLLLLGFIVFNISQNIGMILNFWSNFSILPLIISVLFMILIFIEASFNYHILIRAFTKKINFRQSLYIFILSNAGRYIPGTIWQYIGRVEMARRVAGITRSVSVLELVLEVFLLVNAAVIVSIIAFPFFTGFESNRYLVIFILPFSLILLHPKISRFAINLIAKIGRKKVDLKLLDINFSKIILTLPFFILNFLLNGVAVYFLTESIYPQIEINSVLLFSGAFAFSWVIGYLSIFAPAGLGVTEVVLVYLLSTKMPLPLASTIALSYRVFLTIAELFVFIVVLKSAPSKENEVYVNTKNSWEKRSQHYLYSSEGVTTKSLPPLVNENLDKWMLNQIESEIRKFSGGKSLNILDLGCGYGRLSKPLLLSFKNIKISGIDISKTYVALYNKDLNPGGKAAVGDIKKLKFKSNRFHLTFIVTTLMYLINLKDQKKALKEIIRTLKPGGKLVIIERNPTGYFYFTMGGLVNFLRGKRNKEITAVSIYKNNIETMIGELGCNLDSVNGIPFLSLFLPFSVILNKLSPHLVNTLLRPVNILDKSLPKLLMPSLYLSYVITKPLPKK